MIIPSVVMNSVFLRDVMGQPKALALTLEKLEIDANLLRIAAQLKKGLFRRIVLTGMGSSAYILYPLHVELTENGYTSIVAETSELIHYLSPLLDPSTLIIVASQSGRSVEIVRLLECNAGRATIIGVTNTLGSPLGSRANCVLLTHAGEESSVSCKTYVTTLVALRLLGAVLCGGDSERERSELMQVIQAADDYLGIWEKHVAELAAKVDGVRHWILLGRGPSVAAARTGALTIEESVRVPAEGMSSGAFRHGPIEMLGPETFVLVFLGRGNGRELNRSLYRYVRELRYKTALIGDGTDSVDVAFRLPRVPDNVHTVLEIIPTQMLILALASRMDIEPGQFLIARKTTTQE